MKKLLIIDHFSQTPDEPGNNRFIYLADLLCAQGYDVEVVTTAFSHKAKKTRQLSMDILSGLEYQFTMLPEPGYPRNVCLKRFYSHYVFGRNLKKYLASLKEKPALIYVAVPSLDVGSVAADYCKSNNIPFVVDIQDLWPEAFKLVFDIPVLSDLLFAPMSFQARKFYLQADGIVAVSETYKNRGLKDNRKNVHGLCVYLGTDLQSFDKAVEACPVNKPTDEVWITYVGTLGSSYNIEIVMDGLNHIADRIHQKVVFKVLGDGPKLDSLKKYAQKCKVPVEFLGRLAYPQMTAYLKASDIAVNPIEKGAAQSIINKHADYAAAGLPVISTQECIEYRHLLEKHHCGINCEVDSVEQVGDAIELLLNDVNKRERMGENSRKLAEQCFDRRHTYVEIVQEINKLVNDDEKAFDNGLALLASKK